MKIKYYLTNNKKVHNMFRILIKKYFTNRDSQISIKNHFC